MVESATAEALRQRINVLSQGKWRTAVRMVDTAMICPNPFHAPEPYEEAELILLAKRIKTDGMKTPLTIRAVGTAHHPMFHLIAGEKRFRACLYGGISPVPCVVIDVTPDRLAETNEFPMPRNYFEEADLICEIMEKSGAPRDRMAKSLGVPEWRLSEKLSLLTYTKDERRLLLRSGISETHAVLLLNLSTEEKESFYSAVQSGLCGKKAEEWIAPAPPPRQEARIAVKDIRLFYNTIDKAVDIMQRSGVAIQCKRKEGKSATTLTIRVPKSER